MGRGRRGYIAPSSATLLLGLRLDSCLASVVVNGESTQRYAAGEAHAHKAATGPESSHAAARLADRESTRPEAEADSTSGDLAHDAGYDSLMTSMVFLMQIGHVLKQKGLLWEDVHFR